MNNRNKTRKSITFLGENILTLLGIAVTIALGISSLALNTRTAATREMDGDMPTLSGDAAVVYLKTESTYGSLSDAMAAATGDDDLANNPEAQTKLTANDARPDDRFGSSVAISGDTVIVGAPQLQDNSGGGLRGAAYIFVRNGAGWTFQRKLTSDAPAGDPDEFGLTVGISGDTVVVGAPEQGDFDGDFENGAAYVYVRTGTTWALQKKLSPPDTALAEGESQFGKSVAISGDTVLVATQGLLEFSDHQVLVHVFVRDGTVWAPQAVLTAIDEDEDIRFGESVAISGDMAIVGDTNINDGSVHGESAYIFVRCGTEWTRQQILTAGDGPADRQFGGSVAISGNTVIVGAPADRFGGRRQGSAYIFVTDGTTWTQQRKLIADDGGSDSRFGSSVAILGDTAIVGKPTQRSAAGFDPGTALAYVRSGTAWALQDTITASGGQDGDQFGTVSQSRVTR